VTRIVPRVGPAGRGSAEQWVREKFADEIKAHRSRARFLNLGLVVIIDADLQSVADRKRQLNTSNEMANRGQGPRTEKERIAIFAPKRNVESRFAFLDACDEWRRLGVDGGPYQNPSSVRILLRLRAASRASRAVSSQTARKIAAAVTRG